MNSRKNLYTDKFDTDKPKDSPEKNSDCILVLQHPMFNQQLQTTKDASITDTKCTLNHTR